LGVRPNPCNESPGSAPVSSNYTDFCLLLFRFSFGIFDRGAYLQDTIQHLMRYKSSKPLTRLMFLRVFFRKIRCRLRAGRYKPMTAFVYETGL